MRNARNGNAFPLRQKPVSRRGKPISPGLPATASDNFVEILKNFVEILNNFAEITNNFVGIIQCGGVCSRRSRAKIAWERLCFPQEGLPFPRKRHWLP